MRLVLLLSDTCPPVLTEALGLAWSNLSCVPARVTKPGCSLVPADAVLQKPSSRCGDQGREYPKGGWAASTETSPGKTPSSCPFFLKPPVWVCSHLFCLFGKESDACET